LTSFIDDISIDDASYNVRLLMGVHPFDKLELSEEWYEGYVTTLTIPTVGFMLSTPVLYLTCNIGQKTYMNNQRSKYTQNSKIVMRLNNSFSANYPIIAGNAEFSTTVMSNDLTNVEFKLVDANMVEIDLLSPMYISVSIRAGEINESILSLGNGTSGVMKWMETMKNIDSSKQAAELRNYDILSQMKPEVINSVIGRNLV
jgi:hypothetical protein